MVTVFGVEANIDLPEVLTEKELEELGLDGQKILPGCQHGWFESSVEGGAKLHYRKFLPKKGKPKAIVVFAHGIHAHGGHGVVMDDGRKLNMSLMVEQCMSEGFALYSFDYYGHGYSEGTRFLVPGWEKNLKDLLNFVELATAEHDSQLPCFLWGESYGGCLAIHATRSYQNNPETAPKNFKGVLLQAPAIIGDLPPYPVVFVLRNLLAPYFPRWTPVSTCNAWIYLVILVLHIGTHQLTANYIVLHAQSYQQRSYLARPKDH